VGNSSTRRKGGLTSLKMRYKKLCKISSVALRDADERRNDVGVRQSGCVARTFECVFVGRPSPQSHEEYMCTNYDCNGAGRLVGTKY
jgi:hypothetical protein